MDQEKTSNNTMTEKKKPKPKKATYYVKDPELITDLKVLAVKQNKFVSDLLSEAIRDVLNKYEE